VKLRPHALESVGAHFSVQILLQIVIDWPGRMSNALSVNVKTIEQFLQFMLPGDHE
jgi:hypothetical protein